MAVLQLLLVLSCLISTHSFFQSSKINVKPVPNQSENKIQEITLDEYGVPANGIIDYIGKSAPGNGWKPENTLVYRPATPRQTFSTKFNLFRQYPWKKIGGKFVLKLKLNGNLPLEAAPPSFPFGSPTDLEAVESLSDVQNMFVVAAHDPRVQAIYLQIESLSCGYAKLTEIRRGMEYFRQSGKEIIGYTSGGSEKEFYVSLGCDEFYIPPDGGLDLRGFSAAATFVRGVFDKIGIEPQVQRIGKYKSFGDTFNRTTISDAQREVISSLLMESSEYWAASVAQRFNLSLSDVRALWNDTALKTSYDYKAMGLVTGIKYNDQVETILKRKYRNNKSYNSSVSSILKSVSTEEKSRILSDLSAQFTQDYEQDYNLTSDFLSPIYNVTDEVIQKILKLESKLDSSTRLYPAGLYQRKMSRASRIVASLPVKETFRGNRIAVINAVGGISTGKSSNSGVNGKTLGSDSVIEMIRRVRNDPGIKGLVLRIDSPGGSALASDLMWREIKSLSKVKPVVASMVDVAASGGYYMAMACNKIVAESMTVTGSIGVVTSKFNLEKLYEKIGYSVENLSRGRYAEILASNRGFSDEESKYFEVGAQKAYRSFVTKAAVSRGLEYEDLDKVAQGRVWLGKTAQNIQLVDEIGGLYKAIELVTSLASDLKPNPSNITYIQTFREAKGGPFSFLRGRASASTNSPSEYQYLLDDVYFSTGLYNPVMQLSTLEVLTQLNSNLLADGKFTNIINLLNVMLSLFK